jgi:protein O-GlcNAc transferase
LERPDLPWTCGLNYGRLASEIGGGAADAGADRVCGLPSLRVRADRADSDRGLFAPRLYKAALSPQIVWKACEDCGHVFTAGHFTPEALAVVFSGTHDNQKVGGPVEANRAVAARMVEKVLPYAAEGVWLDVGFGNGALLFTADEYGFRAVGVDLRSDNVRALAALGIEAHCTELSGLRLDAPCAVVSLADVLEHMPFPKLGLAEARRLIKPSGVLLISMPNMDSMLWRLMDQAGQNPYWGELEHYHNFGRRRLYRLLDECGFTPVRYGISERYRACMEVVAIRR